MSAPACREQCAALLREWMAEIGIEITVSTAPPLVAGPYTTDPFRCPHQVTWWIEPTGEQLARWVEAGTP